MRTIEPKVADAQRAHRRNIARIPHDHYLSVTDEALEAWLRTTCEKLEAGLAGADDVVTRRPTGGGRRVGRKE